MSRVVLQTRDGRRWRVADVGGHLAFVVVRRWPHATARRSTRLLTSAAAARVRAAGAGLWAEGGR